MYQNMVEKQNNRSAKKTQQSNFQKPSKQKPNEQELYKQINENENEVDLKQVDFEKHDKVNNGNHTKQINLKTGGSKHISNKNAEHQKPNNQKTNQKKIENQFCENQLKNDPQIQTQNMLQNNIKMIDLEKSNDLNENKQVEISPQQNAIITSKTSLKKLEKTSVNEIVPNQIQNPITCSTAS